MGAEGALNVAPKAAANGRRRCHSPGGRGKLRRRRVFRECIIVEFVLPFDDQINQLKPVSHMGLKMLSVERVSILLLNIFLLYFLVKVLDYALPFFKVQ